MADETPDPVATRAYLKRVEDRITLTTPDGVAKEYVGADTYIAMVRQRDALRRALAFVSAARIPGTGIDVDDLLARHGETLNQARATASIIAQVRGDRA